MFCANSYVQYLLLTGLVAGDNIEPNKGMEKTSKERETVKLSCSYSTNSENVRLYWYRQYPNREPQYLLYRYPPTDYEDTSDDRFHSATTLEKRKEIHVDLEISSAAVSDSALYYCALQPTVTGNISALYKNLLQ
uniref:Ig-like domain-containing protein n=1 Tax=Sinocyclocheilus grahami TaxID=75366 RepID=A0A672PEW5_SINGR